MDKHPRHLIGGAWQSPEHDERKRFASPWPGCDIVTAVGDASPSQIDEAISGARTAQRVWQGMLPGARSQAMVEASSSLLHERDRIAAILTEEVGKTLAESRGEIENAARLLTYFAGAAVRPIGRVFPAQRPNTSVNTVRVPLGVVAAITPWNFPVNLSVMKLGAALAAGNAFVLKPSSTAARTTEAMGEAIAEHFPPGLFNILLGGSRVATALIDSSGVDAVTFTGSTEVGRTIAGRAATRGIPCLAEMGGKNAVVIAASGDVARGVKAALDGAFRMGGQKCTASSLLYVHESQAAAARQAIRALLHDAETYAMGDPTDSATVIGPLIDNAAVQRVQSAVDEATRAGASVIAPDSPDTPDGAFITPQVVVNVTPEMGVFRDELFGPVLAVVEFSELSAVLESLAALDFGLVSSVYTADLEEALSFSAGSPTGTVLVNQPTTGLDFNVPFSGWQGSGYGGVEQSDEALDFYSKQKSVYLSW